MTLKQSIGIGVISLGFLAMGALIYLLFFGGTADVTKVDQAEKSAPQIDTTEQPENEEPTVINPIESVPESNTATNTNPIITDPVEVAKQDLMRIASSFAERFGSYSNQSNYSNINDLRMFMTDKMEVWADNFIREQSAKPIADIYYGITTRAVATEMEKYDSDEGQAVVLVKTRRREASGTTSNYSKTFNQDIQVTLTKEKGSWKIDSAYWQEQ